MANLPRFLPRFLPHSILDRDYWTNLANRPHLAPVLREVESLAASAGSRPPLPSASDYLRARRYNDRNTVDIEWQETRGVLSALIVRRCLLGIDPNDPDDRLLDWLWGYTHHFSWCVSQHLQDMQLPAPYQAWLDRAATEMCALLAEAREILLPWINEVAPALGEAIIHEIDHRVLDHFVAGRMCDNWTPPTGHINNWLGVCSGSLLAAADSMAAQGFARPAVRERCLELLRFFFDHAFTPTGECDEGLAYWTYGLEFSVVGLSRLNSEELASHLELKRLATVADYPRRAHLFGNVFFSGNDSVLHERPTRGVASWLGQLCDNPWLMAWAGQNPRTRTRHLSLILRALDEPAPSGDALPPPPRTQHLPDQQTAIFRTTSAGGELLAVLSGGHNAERHNHNDVGHFIIALGGRLIVPDLGNINYPSDYFGSKRYTYLAASSRGHNVPLFFGYEQRPGREAGASVVAFDEERQAFEIEAAAAYPSECGLRSWRRRLEMGSGAVRIVDHIDAAASAAPVVHTIWSCQKPVARASQVQLGPLLLRLDPRPEAIRISEIDPAEHRLREWQDTKLYRIEAEYRCDGRPLVITSDFDVTKA
jgi:hypothetical protein